MRAEMRYCKGTAQADKQYEQRQRMRFDKKDFPPRKKNTRYAVNLFKWALNKDRRDGNCGGKQANKNGSLLWALRENTNRGSCRIVPMIWYGWKMEYMKTKNDAVISNALDELVFKGEVNE